MLFLQLSSNSIHFSVIHQKQIFFGNNPPIWDKKRPFSSQVGRLLTKKIGLCLITKKWLQIEQPVTTTYLTHKFSYLDLEGEVSGFNVD